MVVADMEVSNLLGTGDDQRTLFERRLSWFRAAQCDVTGQSLHDAVRRRMRESSLGMFLYHLNLAQWHEADVQQDKLDRLRFDIDKRLVDAKRLERRDDICDDLLGLIQESLLGSSGGKVTVKGILNRLKLLRLTASQIVTMDDSLADLLELQVLVLAGNCLQDIPNGSLPKSLLLLELCCNRLRDLSFLQDCPPFLLYLGLGRNYITQDYLSPLKNVQYLYHLDLSQNDIEDLAAVTSACAGLASLSSLLLVGNPCSMVESYTSFITSRLPKLIFLDGAILKESKGLDEQDEEFSATLQITIFRIMSLPKPPTQKINKKKVIQTFRVEVYCPLLKSFVPEREESFVEYALMQENNGDENTNLDKGGKKRSKIKKNTSMITGEAKSGKTKGSAKNKKKSLKKKRSSPVKLKSKVSEIKNLEDLQEAVLYEKVLKEDLPASDSCFVSERKNWGKLIEYTDPTIEVPVCNLTALRDVYRSNLIVHIVHLKTLLPAAKKRKAKVKKKVKESLLSQADENANKDENKEILVSKTVVAKIKIPLQDIVWNTKSLDYSWCVTKPFKVELFPGLKDLQFVVKKKRSKSKKENEETSTVLQIPTALTCHIGVGVKRTHLDNINE